MQQSTQAVGSNTQAKQSQAWDSAAPNDKPPNVKPEKLTWKMLWNSQNNTSTGKTPVDGEQDRNEKQATGSQVIAPSTDRHRRGCVVPRTTITKSSTDWNVSGWRASVVVYCSKWQKKCPPPSLSPGCVLRTQCGDVSHLRLIRWVNIGAEPHRQHMEETNKLFINPWTSDKVALPDSFIYFNKQITNPPIANSAQAGCTEFFANTKKSRQLPEGRVTELHTQDCAAGTAPKKRGQTIFNSTDQHRG